MHSELKVLSKCVKGATGCTLQYTTECREIVSNIYCANGNCKVRIKCTLVMFTAGALWKVIGYNVTSWLVYTQLPGRSLHIYNAPADFLFS